MTFPSEARRDWAVRELDVEPTATPDEVRAAFLGHLADADFVPAANAPRAFDLLSASPPAVPTTLEAEWRFERERQTTEELDAFVASFFRFSPYERRQRWQRFVDRCASCPRLKARLDALKPGLSLPELSLDGDADRVQRLAEYMTELFLSRPEARAVRRQRLMHEMASDRADWRKAAVDLRKTWPDVAALEPQWIAQLTAWNKVRTPPPLPVSVSQPATAGKGGSAWGGGIGVLVGVVIAIARIASRDSASGPEHRPLPAFNPPTWPQQNPELQKYLADLQAGRPNPFAPSRILPPDPDVARAKPVAIRAEDGVAKLSPTDGKVAFAKTEPPPASVAVAKGASADAYLHSPARIKLARPRIFDPFVPFPRPADAP